MSVTKAELPDGWYWSTLGELCHPSQYGWTTKAATEGSVRFLRTTDIAHGPIDWQSVPYCSGPPPDVARYRLSAGDILVSRAGSVGFSALIDEPPPKAVFASYLIRFRPLDARMGKYLALYMQSPAYWQAIGAESVGIALANVNAKKLSAIPVPVPPTEEQDRIVRRMEFLKGLIDDGQAALERALNALQNYLMSALHTSFAEAVPGRADHAEVRLGEVATTTSGGTPNRKNPRYYDGEIPWVKIGDLKGRVITETEASITEDGLGHSSAKLLPPGTLLLAMYGSIGKLGVLGISAATNQAICAIRPGRGVNPDFLYWALFAAQGRLVKMGRGGTQQNIGQADINNLRLPLPLPDEQERIVASVEAVNAQVEAARGALKTSLAGVEGLRAALLRDAVVGQLGLARNAVMKSERKYAAVPFSAE